MSQCTTLCPVSQCTILCDSVVSLSVVGQRGGVSGGAGASRARLAADAEGARRSPVGAVVRDGRTPGAAADPARHRTAAASQVNSPADCVSAARYAIVGGE